MKTFKPSDDFTERVMKEIYAFEGLEEAGLKLYKRIFVSRPFRYALSGGGIFLGIFLAPVVCI